MIQAIALAILRWAARRKLSRTRPSIVAVTGSVGKSTCVSLLDGVMSPGKTVRTTKKGNSETGLPLEILGIHHELTDYRFRTWAKVLLHAMWIGVVGDSDTYDILIAELGIDSPYPPKNMSYLLRIIQHPDIAIITAVAPVHTEQFADGLSDHDKQDESVLLSRIAKEKMLLARAVKPDGYVIVNADSSYIMQQTTGLAAKLITVGEKKAATYAIQKVESSLETGSVVEFSTDKKQYQMQFPEMIIMQENAVIFVSVIAAAKYLGIPILKSIETIERISRVPPGRFTILLGAKETTIIDSSYNASPESMRATLKFLKAIRMKKGRRIAVLGDMRELGPLAEKKHKELARTIAGSADYVVLVGQLMREIVAPELLRIGFPAEKLDVFGTAQGVGRSLMPILRPGDVVLVKGSQNTIFLETVVKELLQKAEDSHLLCRQSRYWDDVRTSFFSSHPNTLYATSTISK